MASLGHGWLPSGTVYNAVELMKMINNDCAVPASLFVCV